MPKNIIRTISTRTLTDIVISPSRSSKWLRKQTGNQFRHAAPNYIRIIKRKVERFNFPFCTPAGVRTLDTLIKSQVLCQLSYKCIICAFKIEISEMRVQRYNFFLKPPNISLFFWKNIITPLTIKKQIRKFRIKLIMKFGNLYKLLHLYKANNQQIRNNIHLVGWKPLECLLRRRLVFTCSVLKPCYLKNVFMLLFPIYYLLYQRSLWQQKSAGNLSALGTL